jgi:hypothetical protein
MVEAIECSQTNLPMILLLGLNIVCIAVLLTLLVLLNIYVHVMLQVSGTEVTVEAETSI